MAKLTDIDGILYRIARCRYQGVWIPDCLIPEVKYQDLLEEKKAKKKPKTPRKILENELDDLWSVKVKENANHTCEKCGATGKQLNSHHIFSRKHKATRWDLDNGICLCVGCHTFGNDSAHVDPKSFMEWLKTYRGEREIDWLEVKSKGRAGLTVSDLEMLKIKLGRE